MKNEMTVEALRDFYKSITTAGLRELDAKGGLLAWGCDEGFTISVGEPSSRAQHEWIQHAGFVSVEIRSPAQEFKTKAALVRSELMEEAEHQICNLDAKLDRPAE